MHTPPARSSSEHLVPDIQEVAAQHIQHDHGCCACELAAAVAQVLVRADLNVPLDKNQKITDDTRIRAAIPTLKYLIENGARVQLTSYLVNPAAQTLRLVCSCTRHGN